MENKQNRIERLKKRTHRCVCKYCGSPLELRRIIYGKAEDARIEIFCSNCDRIEYGIEPEIYQLAKYFVDEMDYNAYPDLDVSEKTKQMSVAKVGEIIAWGCENLNLISEDGFTAEVSLKEDVASETIIICDDDLPIRDLDANF